MGNPFRSYEASAGVSDLAASFAIRCRWTCPTITLAGQVGTRFTYPKRMEGWVELGVGYIPRPSSNHLIMSNRESNPCPRHFNSSVQTVTLPRHQQPRDIFYARELAIAHISYGISVLVGVLVSHPGTIPRPCEIQTFGYHHMIA